MNKEKIFAWLIGLIGVVLSLIAIYLKNIQIMTFGIICFVIVWTMYLIHLLKH